jgi:hypothetical protein
MEGAVQPKIPLPSGRANERVRKHCEAVTRPGGMPNSAVSQVFCLPWGFTPTVLEPGCTKTVPKPYVIAASGLTSSEKQIPRNC